MTTPFERALRWSLGTEASTRSLALIRIGLATILWARWASEVALFRDTSASGLALALGFFVGTSLMFLGLWARASTLFTGAVALTMYHYFGVELGREPWTHHHTYLLAFATLLCGLGPCGASYSLDRWLALRRAQAEGREAPAELGNAWALRLIALQLSVMYLFTALDKTTFTFLSGEQLQRYLLWFYLGFRYPDSTLLDLVLTALSVSTVLLEYSLAFGMLFARTRRRLAIPGLVMHGLFYVLLPVSTYTVTVWLLYLAYFDPDQVSRVIDRLQGHPKKGGAPPERRRERSSDRDRAA